MCDPDSSSGPRGSNSGIHVTEIGSLVLRRSSVRSNRSESYGASIVNPGTAMIQDPPRTIHGGNYGGEHLLTASC